MLYHTLPMFFSGENGFLLAFLLCYKKVVVQAHVVAVTTTVHGTAQSCFTNPRHCLGFEVKAVLPQVPPNALWGRHCVTNSSFSLLRLPPSLLVPALNWSCEWQCVHMSTWVIDKEAVRRESGMCSVPLEFLSLWLRHSTTFYQLLLFSRSWVYKE